jgi:hypothetical protein
MRVRRTSGVPPTMSARFAGMAFVPATTATYRAAVSRRLAS